MAKILDFELFKGEKELDRAYPTFLNNAEKTFQGETPDGVLIIKKIYYTVKYLEGHLTGLYLLNLLGIMFISEKELKQGIQYLVNWLEELVKDLKEYL